MEAIMVAKWRATVIGTRVLSIDGARIGHVRNAGRKIWRCELYKTGEIFDASCLAAGKAWVEAAHNYSG
jgi:hypothetical protein